MYVMSTYLYIASADIYFALVANDNIQKDLS